MDLSKKYKLNKWTMLEVVLLTAFIILSAVIFFAQTAPSADKKHLTLENNEWYFKFSNDAEKIEAGVWGSNLEQNGYRKLDKLGKSMSDEKQRIAYYKTKLSNGSVEDPCIYFHTNDQVFQVYIEDQLLYSFGNFDYFDYKHSPGSPAHLISLPKDYEGKLLTIVMKSVSTSRIGLVRAIELDTKSNHIIRMLKSNIATFILGWINLIIGTVCMFIGIGRRLGRKALLSLGFSFIIVGIWTIAENSLTQFFYFKPRFWFYIGTITFYLLPISIYKFIKDVSRRNKKVLKLLIQIHTVIFIVSITLDTLGVVPIIDTLIYLYGFTLISYISCTLVGIHSYKRGNKKVVGYTLGLVIFGAFGLYDVLGWYFEILPWAGHTAPWGMFIFQLGLIHALIKYLETIQKRFLYYREKLYNKNHKLKEKEKEIDRVKEYDKIRAEFFGNISHELRTPLNIISATLQLIKMYNEKGMLETNKESFNKYLGVMSQNCKRLMKLISNIIDLTKLDSGFYKLYFENMNIVSVVENITLSIEEYAKNKGLSLVFDTELEEIIISCDPDAIERIMLNLLSNAIKFTDAGDSITVTVKEKGNQVLISVEDTGIGIPEEKQRLIFNRFMQVDKTFSRQHEGSGIGLALVESLIEMHKGTIEVQSKLEVGSKFTITLPIVAQDENPTNEKSKQYDSETYKKEKVAIEFSDILPGEYK